jgi:hypothetical protein
LGQYFIEPSDYFDIPMSKTLRFNPKRWVAEGTIEKGEAQ